MTGGVLSLKRASMHVVDADIICQGHTHSPVEMPIVRERLTKTGKIIFEEGSLLNLPSYKNKSTSGNSWESRVGMPPKPIGAYWLRIGIELIKTGERIVVFDISRAK
jgi:hypothetical protein